MDANEATDWALGLLRKRQQTSPKRLVAPGPSPQQIRTLFDAAAQAPDHGLIVPWRFVQVTYASRGRLGEAFSAALLERDRGASIQQMGEARDKAHRAPFLALAVARTQDDHPEIFLAERLVSLGCALQNMLLVAHALGFGAGLVSGQAMDSVALRDLFKIGDKEQAVCFLAVGTTKNTKVARMRPLPETFVSEI